MLLLTTTLGLEGAVSKETKHLGYRIIDSLAGRVLIDADFQAIPFFNINIRTAERILYVVGIFKAQDFDELYENIKSLDLSFMAKNSFVRIVKVRSVNSKLHSPRAIQSVSMKALVDKLDNVDGKIPYLFHIYARNNKFIISVDTTGKKSLHVRGYRKKHSEAPLRETIAASLLVLSGYDSRMPFHDPFCGSGTIAIEAYFLAKNIPPNLKRRFLSENWPELEKTYALEREKAVTGIRLNEPVITCSDIDENILEICRENSMRASANIKILKKDFRKVKTHKDSGIIVSNPPYGKRIKDNVWKDMNILFDNFPNWSINLVSPYKNPFSLRFRPNKTTPFFNSGVKVYFLQFHAKQKRGA